jgi:predicted transcriptional regulator
VVQEVIAMVTKSFRIDEKTVEEVEHFAAGLNFSQVVNEALEAWLAERRRQQRDELVRQSCRARSEAERAELDEIAEQASQSALGLLEDK